MFSARAKVRQLNKGPIALAMAPGGKSPVRPFTHQQKALEESWAPGASAGAQTYREEPETRFCPHSERRTRKHTLTVEFEKHWGGGLAGTKVQGVGGYLTQTREEVGAAAEGPVNRLPEVMLPCFLKD